ncbi:RIO1-domain-containing protein [Epithele typhae]|uniref:RIO1-domain-containing protein n=1 Tax=Epithele typhae TaxID=378194 RepID=UPI002007DEEF|nr:RIO1-domain-containing protein [Epithele typhae]KAH9922804.1 RIO1-domain-containing protein [Epithele typhae]
MASLRGAIEDGQFDDVPESPPTSSAPDPRQGHRFIDDEALLEWASESEEEDSEPDEFEYDEDALEAEVFQELRAEDEDWEIAERDFTKQYNRLRQHVAVRTGAADGVTSAINSKAAVASLPAVNRPRPSKTVPTTATNQQHSKDKTENQLQALSKYSSRLRNLDMPYDLGVGVNRKGPSATANMKDKSDRATNEQVLDPRTRIILFKMIGRGLIYEVNGCVSTGKEANVYHALTPERRHLALKIYKTSILVFKDRDRYVSGEYRFRRGYSRHNPRKMVRVWAEKEMRNLKRLRTAGIRCPEPLEVRENVLVMSFVGDNDGWASPRLKDADIPESAMADLYVELMLMARKMFVECRLVHADLSEYNILYHVPDAAPTDPAASATESEAAPRRRGRRPSVEHDHPHAFDFLRQDLRNVDDFFARRGVPTVGLRRAFEFPADADADGLDGGEARTHEDAVFMRSYIPRTLNEVYDPERDVGVLSRGEGARLIYKDMIGIVGPSEDVDGAGADKDKRTKAVSFVDEGGEAEGGEEDGDEDAGSEEDDESEDDGEFNDRKPRGHRHEDKDTKKERKKAAKAEAREKRKHKIPKAEKKRKVKATARGG